MKVGVGAHALINVVYISCDSESLSCRVNLQIIS
jgi:hypothetical protein